MNYFTFQEGLWNQLEFETATTALGRVYVLLVEFIWSIIKMSKFGIWPENKIQVSSNDGLILHTKQEEI